MHDSRLATRPDRREYYQTAEGRVELFGYIDARATRLAVADTHIHRPPSRWALREYANQPLAVREEYHRRAVLSQHAKRLGPVFRNELGGEYDVVPLPTTEASQSTWPKPERERGPRHYTHEELREFEALRLEREREREIRRREDESSLWWVTEDEDEIVASEIVVKTQK